MDTVDGRKQAVEAVIDAAARWGFDQARASGGAPFMPPVIEWDPDNRPSITTLTVKRKYPDWFEVLWGWYMGLLLLVAAAIFVWAVVQAF